MTTETLNLIVSTFGVAAVTAAVALLKNFLTHSQIVKEVKKAVEAADQFLKNTTGEEKKEWVIDTITSLYPTTWLTEERLNMLIEAAVAEWKKEK